MSLLRKPGYHCGQDMIASEFVSGENLECNTRRQPLQGMHPTKRPKRANLHNALQYRTGVLPNAVRLQVRSADAIDLLTGSVHDTTNRG